MFDMYICNLLMAWCCRVMLELLADIRGEEAQNIADAAYTNATKLFS